MQATETLQERAARLIRRELETSKSSNPRVVWWDDGGYLEQIISLACDRLGVGFTASESNPLSFRRRVLEEPKDPRVWYVPEDMQGRDWFRDIRETGGEIETSIVDLAASLYEDVQPWDICEPDIDEDSMKNVAEVLFDELSEEGFLPSFTELRSDLITKGEGRPLEYILKGGWEQIERDSETIERVRGLLRERNVTSITQDDGIDDIVEKSRMWAVAQWLVNAGLDSQLLPEEYRGVDRGDLHQNVLERVIRSNPSANLDLIYLRSYWSDIVDEHDDPWELAKCPVDGNLEAKLWQDWIDRLEEGKLELCEELAQRRHGALEDVYQDDSAWVQVWSQARHLASLALQFDTWEDRAGETSLVDLYANEEGGTWQIERAVRHLIVTGEPENSLPERHPAKESLRAIREDLLRNQYFEYLERFSEITADAFSTGSALTDEKHAYRFWNDNKPKLATGESATILCLDALRFDLARELAEGLRDDGFEVNETVRVGCLPSETEFGMGSLTPGSPHSFKITMKEGKLNAERNGKNLTTNYRKSLLKEEGWEITEDPEGGWSAPRVAYFDQEFDKIGHNLDEIERKLSTRVDRLHELIKGKIERGDWQRIYIVTDHGFMLLPKNTSMSGISPPEEASDVKRRWIAGPNLEEDSYGVVFDENTGGAGYLDCKVKLLVDPFQRFKKQGISDSRYYHGGALPQEFVLNFISIEGV